MVYVSVAYPLLSHMCCIPHVLVLAACVSMHIEALLLGVFQGVCILLSYDILEVLFLICDYLHVDVVLLCAPS